MSTVQTSRRSPVLVFWLFCLAAAFGIAFFFPSAFAFAHWCGHPTAVYKGRTIHLPVFWTQTQDATSTSWERPRRNAASPFEDQVAVSLTPHEATDADSLALWKRVYGVPGDSELQSYPQLQSLLKLGMICGSIKYGHLDGKRDGIMAIGCLTRDHATTYTYTGAESGLAPAVSILQQIQ